MFETLQSEKVRKILLGNFYHPPPPLSFNFKCVLTLINASVLQSQLYSIRMCVFTKRITSENGKIGKLVIDVLPS